MNIYRLTLCTDKGTFIGVVPDAPFLPRFVHLHRLDGDDGNNTTVVLTDDAEPGVEDGADRVVTFARIASSVWIDDDRDALYVTRRGMTKENP